MLSPHTVYVFPFNTQYRWRCGCGKWRVFDDERECREDGLAHQQSHVRRPAPSGEGSTDG